MDYELTEKMVLQKKKSTRKTKGGLITRRKFIKIAGSASALLSINCTGFTRNIITSKTKTFPNILFIITDQQHIDTISARGCRNVTTSTMDHLVKQGTCFTESFSANPICSPARSSLFTGRPSSETGVHVNGHPIRDDIPNIGQWFQSHSSYETVYAGKWHLPGTHQAQIPGFRVLTTAMSFHGILGDTATSQACAAYINNRSSSNPYLMVASFMQPHDMCEWLRLNQNNQESLRYKELANELPQLPDNFDFDSQEPEHLINMRKNDEPALGGWKEEHWRYYRWSYYRQVEMVDAQIGRILQAVYDKRQEQETIVVFTSDHGEGLGHHRNVRKNISYNEALKVPMIITCPGLIPTNQVNSQQLVTGLDIMPTICDYSGISCPENIRGRSLAPVITDGKNDSTQFIVMELAANKGRVVRSERFKYVVYHEDLIEQLFDINNDPGEKVNLAGSVDYSDIVDGLRKMLMQWESRLDTATDLPAADAWWRQG